MSRPHPLPRADRAFRSAALQPAPGARASKQPVLKIDCRSCGRSLPVLEFTTSTRGLHLTCPSCHRRFFLEPPARGGEGGKQGAFHCPKCLRSVRSGSKSCPKCGLIFALWEDGTVREHGTAEAMPWDAPVDLRADALWRRVEARPDDEASHEAFLVHCQESRQLDFAARRYQTFLHRNPDHPLGRANRDRIVLLAQFNARPSPKPRYSPRRFSGLKTVLILGLTALLWGLVMMPVFLKS